MLLLWKQMKLKPNHNSVKAVKPYFCFEKLCALPPYPRIDNNPSRFVQQPTLNSLTPRPRPQISDALSLIWSVAYLVNCLTDFRSAMLQQPTPLHSWLRKLNTLLPTKWDSELLHFGNRQLHVCSRKKSSKIRKQ